ncbi:flagellar hook-length control protein [Nitrobacter hamburgensis X14]|uniref:Flagellar hook-length control protein n=1 Tax=Nitrobacter hamburgensis (strain DSM 10229 / NCIMB 13809 / X14) TaxID=323097 RepID=Q1QQB6_NITHX|nr:flagellar hook-length control protein [Nitrobacter hamburgensis X14]
MLSVTSETTTGVSFPNARQRSERDDRSAGGTFGALVDINAQASQASTAQRPNLPDQQDMRPDRLANASPRDRTMPADDNDQTRGSQTSSSRPPETDSAGPRTGIQKPAAGTETSGDTHHHRAKHEGIDVTSTGDASDPMMAVSDTTTADPTVPPQPVTTLPAVAVPVAAPLSAAAAPAATAATDSAIVSTGAAGALPAQAASAAQVTPAGTGFNPAVAADSTASTAAMQTGNALAAAVAAATPATAKATVKTPDTTQPGKTTASVMTGLQPGLMPPDVTAPPAASGNPGAPHAAAASDHKHDAVATDGAKTASSDTGTLATQPGAAATPQHSAQTADAAPQPQPGQTDSGQPQGLNSALAQPQVQSTAATTPVTPQYNVAVAAGAAVPLNGLAVQIAVTALSGKSRFEIRLDPADLGRIDVRLDVDRQGRVTSHLTVEKPETLAMLRQDAPQLQRALQDAGLKTGDGGLQFSLRDQSSQGQTPRDDTGRNTRHLIVTEDAVVPVATAGRSYGRMLGSSRGLDIRV